MKFLDVFYINAILWIVWGTLLNNLPMESYKKTIKQANSSLSVRAKKRLKTLAFGFSVLIMCLLALITSLIMWVAIIIVR